MKKLHAVLALVLAILLVIAQPAAVLANEIGNYDQYQGMLSNARENQQTGEPTVAPGADDVIYTPTVETVDTGVEIYGSREEAAVTDGAANLPRNGLLKVTASAAGQWQVRVPSAEIWVDFQNETADSMNVTFAKVANLQDANGNVYIRNASIADAVLTICITEAVALPESTRLILLANESAAQPEIQAQAMPAAANYGLMLAAEVPTTYSVVINYVFTDGKQAASPYTATVAAGSDLNVTVNSPVVLGYAPAEGKESITINETNIQENITENVTYYPAEVNFTVKHYQQNVNDDHYTLVNTETKTGYTESAVGKDLGKSYTGFYSLLYDDTVKIAADGSTVVEIYYDRYYYLMNFDLDGGYGVEPIYARYGAPIEVGTPTKAGYTFSGWDKTIPATMPAENTTFKAQWTAGDSAKVTVVFWGENPNDENYSYLSSYDIQRRPGDTLTYDSLDDAVHTHGASCYPGAGTAANRVNGPSNPVDGLVYKGSYYGSTYSYIYIGGQWYNYSGSASDGDIVASTCGKMDAKLWQYAKSDKIIVAADGSSVMNVYFDRTEFTLTFYFNWESEGWFSGEYKSSAVITDKWGANIGNRWTEKSTTANSTNWSESYDASSPWTGYLDIMPRKDMTYYAAGDGNYTAKYYIEDLNGNYVEKFSISGKGSGITEEDFFEMEGFTYDHGTSGENDSMPNPGSYSGFGGAEFYYTRNSYKLEFMSSGTKLEDHSKTVKYQAPLTFHNFTPDDPTNLEPGAYKFDGWYSDQYFENEVDWDTATMPASDVMLYAKWVPVTHTVEVYLTSTNMVNRIKLIDPQTVSHGDTANAPADELVKNGNWTFRTWMYVKRDGSTGAFDFSMPITCDMRIYGVWFSDVNVPYVIKYAVDADGDNKADTDDEGNVIYIAEDTTGYALAGSTKTFDAKTGSELYDLSESGGQNYQSGYFPKTNSHSMEFNISGNNEYTFLYVPKAKVSYTVRYLEEGTNAVLHEENTVETRDAIVTETFVPVTGYMPDAYQKRLVLSANEEENVIIFWYVQDDTHAPLHIVHWIQNIEDKEDGTSTYTLYQESTDINALIGTEYSEKPLTIPGFEYVERMGQASGIMTAAGLELDLYYNRIEYPYEFRFLEQGTDRVLAPAVTGYARYEAHVWQNFIPIAGYHMVSASPQAILIAITDPDDVANKNVRTFYYQENEVTINYEVVGPEGCGTVTPTSEIDAKAVHGPVNGSTAEPASNVYKFVGWYKDEACMQPVEEAWVTNTTHITPAKTGNKDANGVAQTYEDATYYAKFEYNLTSMTISKTGTAYENSDTFIFDVYRGESKITTVTLKMGESVIISGLTVGETYTVKERTAGTRYTEHAELSKKLTADVNNNAVTFTNSVKENEWLTASGSVKNVFQKNGNE